MRSIRAPRRIETPAPAPVPTTVSGSSSFHLLRPKAPLPGQVDFDPWGGCLDALHAWENFGELSLDQAYRLFVENPGYYQEDFMFMGPAAFDYYFPVIDRFLREFRRADDDDLDDGCAWILGAAMISQLESAKPRPIAAQTAAEIRGLAAFVIREIDRYASEAEAQRRILEPWRKADLLAAGRIGDHGSGPREMFT